MPNNLTNLKGLPMLYTKKPVTIKAIQWTGDNAAEIADFFNAGEHTLSEEGVITIATLEGDMRASVGDYIIRGVAGEVYPCKADIFHMTYEPATDSSASQH